MRPTQQQLSFFHRFGYLVVRQLFDAREVAAVTHAFERTMHDFGTARVHDGTRRTGILGPIQHIPEMNGILDHPGILDLAGGILGDDFNYACGDGNYYSGETGWHPDGDWHQLFACKILFYLDPLTRATGALRVIPGSHLPDHPLRAGGAKPAERLMAWLNESGLGQSEYPGDVAVETQPGDIIIFNHDLLHASFGGGKRRRMFTMNLTRHCETPEDLALLRSYVSVHSPGGYKLPIGGMYFRPILDTASPARMRHLEQCRGIHDELFPHLVEQQTHRQQVENMLKVMHPEALAAV